MDIWLEAWVIAGKFDRLAKRVGLGWSFERNGLVQFLKFGDLLGPTRG